MPLNPSADLGGFSNLRGLGVRVLAVFGLWSPLEPVLFLQLSYKAIWFIAVLLPLVVKGQFPLYGVMLVVIFASYVIGDLIAIPFRYLFAKEAYRPVA